MEYDDIIYENHRNVDQEQIYMIELTTGELSQIIQLVEGSRNYMKWKLLNKLYWAEIVE